jgi:hypothetical protein
MNGVVKRQVIVGNIEQPIEGICQWTVDGELNGIPGIENNVEPWMIPSVEPPR